MKFRSVALVLAVLVTVSGCGRPEVEVQEKENIKSVEVYDVMQKSIDEVTQVTGQVIAKNTSQVKAKASGRIERWNKKVGEKVQKGESVVVLGSDLALEAQRDISVANLDAQTAVQNVELAKVQNRANTKDAETDISNARDRLAVAQRNMNETLTKIQNQTADLTRTITTTTQKIGNKKIEIETDVDRLIGFTGVKDADNEDFRKKVENFANTTMKNARTQYAVVSNINPEGNDNKILLEQWIETSIQISELLGTVLSALNATIPVPSDQATYDSFLSTYEAHRATIDAEIVGLTQLLNTWNQTTSANVFEQEQAYLNVQTAQRELDQEMKEYEAVISRNEVNTKSAQVQLSQAQFALQTAQRNVQSLEGKAPVSGTLAVRNRNVGDEVAVGEVLYEIVDPSGVEVRVFVIADTAKRLRTGMPVQIDGREYEIMAVASVPTGIGNKYEVKIAADPVHLSVGKFVDVEFSIPREQAIWVPLSSVDLREGAAYVWKVKEDTSIERIKVEILQLADSFAKIEEIEPITIIKNAKGIAADSKVQPKTE